MKLKVLTLVLGDLIALYVALFLTLVVRYGSRFYGAFVDVHAAPFTIVFVGWLTMFYIAGLYDLRRLRNNLEFLKTLALSLAVNAALAGLLFYLIPVFGITPKTNLLIFIIIFAIVEMWWRRLFNRITASGETPNRVLLIGNGIAATEIEAAIRENRQLGYEIAARMSEDDTARSGEALGTTVSEKHANMIVVPREFKKQSIIAPALYRLFGKGISVIDLDNFYEIVMRKVPLADLEETWFLENIEGAAQFYDQLKRAFEFVAAIAIGLILLPLEVLIGFLVILTSRGPVIYRQTRVGKNGCEFTLYKFRTMRHNAEQNGAQWAAAKDSRVTFIGKILRASHLDELPQLANIVRGDLSFVGPRPERPEFIAKLKTEVLYYEVRLLVKPGVTGWAQVNYPADRNLEDVKQKLQYDIYYLKNRSVILDLAIILKTLKSIFVKPD